MMFLEMPVINSHVITVNYVAKLITQSQVCVVVLAVTLLAQIRAGLTQPLHLKRLGNRSAVPVLAGSIYDHRKRSLRASSDPTGPIDSDEERIGVKEVLGKIVSALKMKVKMKYWLWRGKAPEKVLEKLQVTSPTDKNYKYYSKYFFRYYVKYPNRQPPNLLPKTADEIMKARLHHWLDKRLTPPQVFTELGFKGSFASAHGLPNYNYFEDYVKMWGDLQERLSKSNAYKTRS
ncbi:unnamed protein product [Phytophthora lilii]|uniref:RxLR effector protein n=1 Tax=Phytophthora lilii TaxID=2077276 RepID=A0A9W6X210_9STRA|nr:unnamed protein product [Phytophthora lilii]